APGARNHKLALQVGHNLLVAHGLAMQAIHAAEPKTQVGIVLNISPVEPASDSERDCKIAETQWNATAGWFLDALFKAYYPPDTLKSFGRLAPEAKPDDFALIAQHMDFLGVNYYSRTVIGMQGVVKQVPGSKYTDMDWEIHAPALGRLLSRLSKEYRLPPIYITENGASFADHISGDGQVHDQERIDYLREHLGEIKKAIAAGIDVKGYFLWSLMDNFEWAHGFSKRFGITHVDFESQKRVIKESGHWYAGVINRNAVEA